MKNTAVNDVLKITGYVVICFLLAALLSPPLYQIGKGFAEAAVNRDTTENIGWLAGKAHKAAFEVYFKRMLMLCAVLLLVPLIYSLRLKVDPLKLKQSRWSIYLPEAVRDQNIGQPLIKNQARSPHLFIGLGLSCAFFFLMAVLLFQLGWFSYRTGTTSETWVKAVTGAITPASIISVIEELLFRGALLGIFLRAFKPRLAIVLLSFLFAAVHFLQPPKDAILTEPGSAGAGFELLGLIGMRFLHPEAMLYEFSTLLLVGLILAYARYRTASLWLPIGLHAGWILAFKVFKKVAERDPNLPDRYDIFIGDLLTEGLIPLATLLLTWVALLFLIPNRKNFDPN